MSDSLVRRLCLIPALTIFLSLAACSTVDGASNRLISWITPYKIDIVQGNFVSSEQAAVLQQGMSRNQVKEVLGTPLLTSVFHENRWDYVFTFRRQGAEPQARKVTLFFDGDALNRVEADALPTEAEFVASLDSGQKLGAIPILEAPAGSLKTPVLPAKPSTPAPQRPLPASYPPLE